MRTKEENQIWLSTDSSAKDSSGSLNVLSHLIHTKPLEGWSYYPHSTDEELQGLRHIQ